MGKPNPEKQLEHALAAIAHDWFGQTDGMRRRAVSQHGTYMIVLNALRGTTPGAIYRNARLEFPDLVARLRGKVSEVDDVAIIGWLAKRDLLPEIPNEKLRKIANDFVRQAFDLSSSGRIGGTISILNLALNGAVLTRHKAVITLDDIVTALRQSEQPKEVILAWLVINGLKPPTVDERIEVAVIDYVESFLTGHGYSVETIVETLNLLLRGTLPGSEGAPLRWDDVVSQVASDSKISKSQVEKWLKSHGARPLK